MDILLLEILYLDILLLEILFLDILLLEILYLDILLLEILYLEIIFLQRWKKLTKKHTQNFKSEKLAHKIFLKIA